MKKKDYKLFTIVEIDWLDSLHKFGWTNHKGNKIDDTQLEHKTVGFFRGNSKHCIHVCQSYGSEGEDSDRNVDALMQIPWCSITKIRVIK